MTEDRKYTDEQMALILRRVGELQSQREEGRHSLAEIQEIARQVGLDASLVPHVAAGVQRRSPVAAAGSAVVQTVETVLPVRVSPEQMGRLLDAIRRASGAQGASRQVFDTVEWRAGSEHELVDVRVTITPASRGTNVRVQHDGSGALMLGGILSTVPTFIAGLAAFSLLPGPGAAVVTTVIAGAAGGGFLAFRRWLSRRGDALVRRVASAVSEEAIED